MMSLPGHFRPPEVTFHHFLSSSCHLLRVTALQELKRTENLQAFYSHLQVTSGQMTSLPGNFRLSEVT